MLGLGLMGSPKETPGLGTGLQGDLGIFEADFGRIHCSPYVLTLDLPLGV